MPTRPIPPPPPPRPNFVPNGEYRPPVLPKREVEEVKTESEKVAAQQTFPEVAQNPAPQEAPVQPLKEENAEHNEKKKEVKEGQAKGSSGLAGALLALLGFAFVIAAIILVVLMFI